MSLPAFYIRLRSRFFGYYWTPTKSSDVSAGKIAYIGKLRSSEQKYFGVERKSHPTCSSNFLSTRKSVSKYISWVEVNVKWVEVNVDKNTIKGVTQVIVRITMEHWPLQEYPKCHRENARWWIEIYTRGKYMNSSLVKIRISTDLSATRLLMSVASFLNR